MTSSIRTIASGPHLAPTTRDIANPAELGRLFADYGPRIYALAYRMTGNRQDAEDITQETFLQAHRGADGFRGESDASTWIYAIARNLCHAHFRRAKRSSFHAMEALLEDAATFEAPSDLEAWARADLARQVRDGCLTGLLRCLSFNQRVAFVLHVLLHLPMRDVAAILGKSEGATKVLVHRARRSLKGFMCSHCSAYDPDNPCRCENLIGFSLQRQWIQPLAAGEAPAPDLTRLEVQIADARRVVEVYERLAEPRPRKELLEHIGEIVRSDRSGVFSGGTA